MAIRRGTAPNAEMREETTEIETEMEADPTETTLMEDTTGRGEWMTRMNMTMKGRRMATRTEMQAAAEGAASRADLEETGLTEEDVVPEEADLNSG